jgi:hypothetical protein
MKCADRLPITVARFGAQDSLRVFPIPGSIRFAIKSRFTFAIEDPGIGAISAAAKPLAT